MKCASFFVATLVAVASLASVARAEQITDAALGFSLTIPDGFARDPQLAAANRDFIYAFRKTDPQGLVKMIIIERLPGVIGRERLNPKKIPVGLTGTLLSFRWHNFDIDGFEVPEKVSGIPTINYNVQVPLKPKAIQSPSTWSDRSMVSRKNAWFSSPRT